MANLEYIPEPSIIMLGVQPWPPAYNEGDPCPVCKDGIKPGDDGLYCACCDALSPSREAMVRAALIGVGRKDRGREAEKKARESLRREHETVLTEQQRRRVWHGCRTEFDSDADVANRAKVAREWLASINQLPDFSIQLRRREPLARPRSRSRRVIQ